MKKSFKFESLQKKYAEIASENQKLAKMKKNLQDQIGNLKVD